MQLDIFYRKILTYIFKNDWFSKYFNLNKFEILIIIKLKFKILPIQTFLH